mgnify:FL=1
MYIYEPIRKSLKERMEEKEEEVYAAIDFYSREKGYSPSVRELRRMVQLGSTSTTMQYLYRLRDKGKVTWIPGKPRTIKIIAHQ